MIENLKLIWQIQARGNSCPPPPVHPHHCALYLRMSGLEKIEQNKIAKCPLYSCTEDEQWKKTNLSHCHFQYSVFVNSYPGWYWWHSTSAGELKGKRIGQCLTIIEGGPPASRQGKSTNIKILSNDDCQTVDEIFDLRCKIYDLQNFTNLCKVGLREGIK